MTEVKRTPTPWRVEGNTTLIWGACNPDDLSSYGMGYPIAECRVSPMSTSTWCKAPYSDEGEANAAHIVKCVNLHDELVDFSKDLYTSIMAVGGIALIDHLKPEIEGLKQVLKKAGAL